MGNFSVAPADKTMRPEVNSVSESEYQGFNAKFGHWFRIWNEEGQSQLDGLKTLCFSCLEGQQVNPLTTKHNLFDRKTHFVPRSKHFPSRS